MMVTKKIILAAALMAATVSTMSASEQVLSLDGNWKFRQVNTEKWMDAHVPGCTHTDLMDAGMIPDPFYSDNEKNLQWIGEKDWEYMKEFEVPEELMENTHVELLMNGIDTYADVYVNGKFLVSCDNMFRTWRTDIRPYLNVGKNTIRIRFHSIFKIDMPKYLDADFKRMAWPNNDQSDIWLSLYARKAGYNYGWDWGPRLITAGIWRSISIHAWSDADLRDVFIKTISIPDGRKRFADMEATCEIISDKAMSGTLSLKVAGQKFEETVSLEKGTNTHTLKFRMKDPELWWCNGAGKQKLYDFDVYLSSGEFSDSATVTAGVRTIEVVREDDQWGKSMYLVLNGRPIFMKGANYIPADNFPARVAPQAYEHIVKTAAISNMNMLRIWGGGIYENDVFYELCDRYGILIWHDMMFACGMFPADEKYLESVSNEVKDNVIRLRNHPSIALWNGNNENEISYFGWGWRDRLSPEADRIYQADLEKLFYGTIPDALEETDGTRYYHPTSPVTGYNGVGSNYGDVHFWSVWKGGWIEEYDLPENIGRFMSEYGFQSYPSLQTLKKVIPADQMYIGSNVMLAHQRARHDDTRDPHFGDNMMKMYMSRYFSVPEDFGNFIFISQLMQAEAVKKAIEAHRRAKPYCMGSLYWQINDCWPVASWSSMDYSGNWKPLQYYARRLFSDILVSAYIKSENEISFKVTSDLSVPFSGTLAIKAQTLDGKAVSAWSQKFRLDPDGCSDIITIDRNSLFGEYNDNEVFVSMKVVSAGKCFSENVYYPAYPGKYEYPEPEFNMEITPSGAGYTISLESDVLVRDLWFTSEVGDTFFEDNAVTLIPGEKKNIFVRTDVPLDEFRESLSWITLNTVQNEESK